MVTDCPALTVTLFGCVVIVGFATFASSAGSSFSHTRASVLSGSSAKAAGSSPMHRQKHRRKEMVFRNDFISITSSYAVVLYPYLVLFNHILDFNASIFRARFLHFSCFLVAYGCLFLPLAAPVRSSPPKEKRRPGENRGVGSYSVSG